MAVHRAPSAEIPKNAVPISESEAFSIQWHLVDNWEPQSDVWAVKYGAALLAGAAGITSWMLNEYYRRKVKLGSLARIATYVPNVVCPAVVCFISHLEYSTKDVLIGKTPCASCHQLRSAAIQVATSTLYPIILAPISSFMFATRYYTMAIPSIVENPKELLLMWKKMTKPLVKNLGISVVLQTAFAMTIMHLQSSATWKMSEQPQKLEKMLRHYERSKEGL